jgi:hypothetical protein
LSKKELTAQLQAYNVHARKDKTKDALANQLRQHYITKILPGLVKNHDGYLNYNGGNYRFYYQKKNGFIFKCSRYRHPDKTWTSRYAVTKAYSEMASEPTFESTALPLVILFQHPCPTKNLHKLSIASSDCFNALNETMVESIHYVYDWHSNPVKKCWDYETLQSIITARCSTSILECIEFTSQRTISEMSADKVQHPVCGLVPRVGWAALKKGIEMSFSVFRKVQLP